MPTRGFSVTRISEFGGLADGLAIQAGENQGSIVRNLLKKRRSLVRRPGFSFVAEATLTINPLTLDNLELYLRSDEVVGADGSAVSSWPDISGNARHATQATGSKQPVLRRTGGLISPSGEPMVEFDGLDDILRGVLPGGGTISTSAGLMIYVYYNQISLTNSSAFDTQQLFWCGNSVSIFELVADTSVDIGVGWPDNEIGTNTGNVRDIYGAAVLGHQLLTWELIPPPAAGAEFKVYRDGVQIGTTQTNWQATDIRTDYGIGANPGENTAFRGTVGAVLVFSEVHDEDTRVGVEAFLTELFEG